MPPPGPIQAPQPLLSIGDSPRGPIANPLMGPPIVSGNIPPFLLPSPGGQVRRERGRGREREGRGGREEGREGGREYRRLCEV